MPIVSFEAPLHMPCGPNVRLVIRNVGRVEAVFEMGYKSALNALQSHMQENKGTYQLEFVENPDELATVTADGRGGFSLVGNTER
jgi:hypothetical protein